MKFIQRFQEFTGWIPVVVVLSIAGWLVLGVMDRAAGSDTLALLMELPVLCAYALAAVGVSYLARRRFRRKLTDQEQVELWRAVLQGNKGACFIYFLDVVVWLGSLIALLVFFAQ